jgi:hypothetical protein
LLRLIKAALCKKAGKIFFDFYSLVIACELRNAKQYLVPELRQKFQADEIITFRDVMVWESRAQASYQLLKIL